MSTLSSTSTDVVRDVVEAVVKRGKVVKRDGAHVDPWRYGNSLGFEPVTVVAHRFDVEQVHENVDYNYDEATVTTTKWVACEVDLVQAGSSITVQLEGSAMAILGQGVDLAGTVIDVTPS